MEQQARPNECGRMMLAAKTAKAILDYLYRRIFLPDGRWVVSPVELFVGDEIIAIRCRANPALETPGEPATYEVNVKFCPSDDFLVVRESLDRIADAWNGLWGEKIVAGTN